MKNLFNNKIFKIIMKITKVLVSVVLIAFVLCVCLQRFSNNRLSLFNYRMFTVVSGSMIPKYNIGDVLISQDVDASVIEIGDDISYLGVKGDFKDKVITHEVLNIYKKEDGSRIFHTKGLTNIVEDPIVYENQLYGKVIYKSPLLSVIYKMVNTRLGFYFLIIFPLAFIIGFEIIATMLEKEDVRRKSK